MPLEEIFKTNARFVAESRADPQPHEPRKHWAVVSCMDFRLSDFLERAIGVRRGDAIMIRNAGNTRTPTDSSVIRSLVAGVLLFDIREVLVIGHTGCGMRMDVAKAIDRMKALGIQRESLGVHDVREWLGLIPDESENVRQVVQAIAASPFIPKAIAIYGFVIDVDSGRLTYVAGRLATGEVPLNQKNSAAAHANEPTFVVARNLPSRSEA